MHRTRGSRTYSKRGILDTSFGDTGHVDTAIGTGDEASAVRVMADGRSVAAGVAGVDNNRFGLVRCCP